MNKRDRLNVVLTNIGNRKVDKKMIGMQYIT